MFIFIFSFLFSKALAEQPTFNFNIHHQYEATRALGMGDTFSGIDDYNVLFYNPAGLASIDGHEFNFGIGGGISRDAIQFTKDVENAAKSSSNTTTQETNVSNVLEQSYGKVYAARAPKVSFIYAHKNWGVALIPVDLSVAMMPHQVVGPGVDVTAFQDTTLAFGYAKKSHDKKFSWGFMGKAIYRGSIDQDKIAADIALNNGKVFQNSDFNEGLTVDADLGVQYSPYLGIDHGFFKFANPTFAMVLHNIADEGFFHSYHLISKQDGKPEKLGRDLDIGSRWDLPDLGVFQTKIMIDERDMFDQYFTLLKGFHMGGELVYDFGYGLNGSIQGGINQGYWTAGFGIQTLFIKLELVSYAEEYGAPGDRICDREYMAQFNLNF